MSDGGYRGNPEGVMPYRKPRDGKRTTGLEAGLQRRTSQDPGSRRTCPGPTQDLQILRDYCRAAQTLAVTASGIDHLHNIALAG